MHPSISFLGGILLLLRAFGCTFQCCLSLQIICKPSNQHLASLDLSVVLHGVFQILTLFFGNSILRLKILGSETILQLISA